jgi:MYXO-CTERM domain-containing protein
MRLLAIAIAVSLAAWSSSVAAQTEQPAQEQPTTTEQPTTGQTTETAAQARGDEDADIGWIGLLGLLGLAGLIRRREPVVVTPSDTTARTTTTRSPRDSL